MQDLKATDVPVVRFFREQPVSKLSPDFHEADGAALISRVRTGCFTATRDRRGAKKLFDQAVTAHPERAIFVAETCELAGAYTMARKYYEKATRQPITAAHAWHRLGMMTEARANRGIGALFARRNSMARAAFTHAVDLNVAESEVARFESWADRFTHAWLGVSCYDYLHHKRNPLHLRHLHTMAFMAATSSFSAALPHQPEAVLAQMDVLLQSPMTRKEAMRVHNEVLVPMCTYLRSNAVNASATKWILAQRVLRLGATLTDIPELHCGLRDVIAAVLEGPLGSQSVESHAMQEVQAKIGLVPQASRETPAKT